MALVVTFQSTPQVIYSLYWVYVTKFRIGGGENGGRQW